MRSKKHFLITLQNHPRQRSIVSKLTSNLTEIAARVFIGILQNIFRSGAIIFSQSP